MISNSSRGTRPLLKTLASRQSQNLYKFMFTISIKEFEYDLNLPFIDFGILFIQDICYLITSNNSTGI